MTERWQTPVLPSTPNTQGLGPLDWAYPYHILRWMAEFAVRFGVNMEVSVVKQTMKGRYPRKGRVWMWVIWGEIGGEK